jgi:hypothetical protein
VWPLFEPVDTEAEAYTADVIKIIFVARNDKFAGACRWRARPFLKAQNLIDHSKFAERLCVQATSSGERREFSINTRRRRTAAIHNEIRKLIKPCDRSVLSCTTAHAVGLGNASGAGYPGWLCAGE